MQSGKQIKGQQKLILLQHVLLWEQEPWRSLGSDTNQIDLRGMCALRAQSLGLL